MQPTSSWAGFFGAEDPVEYLTQRRFAARNQTPPEQCASSPSPERRLLVTSLTLAALLFAILGRLAWLTEEPASRVAIDDVLLPLALMLVLLLVVSKLGWDRVQRRRIEQIRQCTEQAVHDARNSGERRPP